MTSYLVYFVIAGAAARAARASLTVGVDMIISTVTNVSKWAFQKDQTKAELTVLEKDMVDKIQRGDLRLYEVAIPSFVDQEGVFTRFIMIDNKQSNTYTRYPDEEGPVWL